MGQGGITGALLFLLALLLRATSSQSRSSQAAQRSMSFGQNTIHSAILLGSGCYFLVRRSIPLIYNFPQGLMLYRQICHTFHSLSSAVIGRAVDRIKYIIAMLEAWPTGNDLHGVTNRSMTSLDSPILLFLLLRFHRLLPCSLIPTAFHGDQR